VAIVHDWLVTFAGAERVLEGMLECFPEAELYSLLDFLPDDQRQALGGRSVTTSFLQRIPFARRRYRSFLPLMPFAVEQFDLAGFDLVISSSYAVAKGVLTGPDQLHICMCYSPARYAWDLQGQYLQESGLDRGLRGTIAKYFLHRFRLWDAGSADRVDDYIAISRFIARRIRKAYGRDATVIYPPVDIDYFCPAPETKEEFYLTASRVVPYKKIPLIVEAFRTMPGKRLVVIGEGPEMARARAAAGPNITFLGHQPMASLRAHLRRARAFVFAAEEDFGIAPLEAQACGTPVVAYGRGGALETIRGLETSAPTGVFFSEQTTTALAAAIDIFEKASHRITPEACRENASRFGRVRFHQEFRAHVEERWQRFQQERGVACGS